MLARSFEQDHAIKDGHNEYVHKATVQTINSGLCLTLLCLTFYSPGISDVLLMWLEKQNTTQLCSGKSFQFYGTVGCTWWENSACTD